MREFKYVIIDTLYPRVCSLAEQHKDLLPYHTKATSAGKARLHIDARTGKLSASCYGESISLGVKSDPEHDAALLLRLFADPFQ